MNLKYLTDPNLIDWELLKTHLVTDNFHNGRSTKQLKLSFENSQVQIYCVDGDQCIGTARALSDGVCNAYVIDVWTFTPYRNQGVAAAMMEMIISRCPGQHIYLFTDDAVEFYKKSGFVERPVGLEIVSGEWLQNSSQE